MVARITSRLNYPKLVSEIPVSVIEANKPEPTYNPHKNPQWTEEERRILRACWAGRGLKDARVKLPNRTKNAICAQAVSLGLEKRRTGRSL